MTGTGQIDLFDTFVMNLRKTLQKKGADYGAEEDILKNFSEVALLVKILNIDTSTASGQVLEMIVRKIHRICNLKSQGKEGENESIEDSILDLLGYSFLLKCTEHELASH